MYSSSSPFFSPPSTPTTSRTTSITLHLFRHPSPPFHHHKHRRRLILNSTHKPISLIPNLPSKKPPNNLLLYFITKPITFALFSVAISLCPFPQLQPPAIAITTSRGKKQLNLQSLVEAASNLTLVIEKVSNGKGNINQVELALKNVKFIKANLSRRIKLQLRHDVDALEYKLKNYVSRARHIENFVEDVADSYDMLLVDGGDNIKGKVEGDFGKIMVTTKKNVDVYNRVAKVIDVIGDRIDKKDINGQLELAKIEFIEMQCNKLVDEFTRSMSKKRIPSAAQISLTKLSRSEIQKDLQSAQRQILEQRILPNVVGDEKRVIVNNTVDEIVKGIPEVELKWMFGDKEVLVPNAVKSHLFHGWRRWRKDIKDDLKRNLLENVEVGKKYVAERQERILLERDKVMSRTWFNGERNRWEMDPVAVPYAVSRKLVESARIRYDAGAMYLFLKGSEKEHYVDLKEYEILFEDFGGFDGLYLQMVAAGTPMAIQLMWIPLSELTVHERFLFLKSVSKQCWMGLRNSTTLSFIKDEFLRFMQNTTADVLVMTIIPVLDLINSYLERTPSGLTLLNYADRHFNWSFFFTKWQYELGQSFQSRNTIDFFWYFRTIFRVFVWGLVFIAALGGSLSIFKIFGTSLREGRQNRYYLERVRSYFKYKRLRIRRRKKGRKDPITSAFDRMKRVRNPPIRLKDFASVDSMREEVNEVVAFLQNPNAFQDMGARAPRGVLIVGESGSGKTSLALAIAAEAFVPVVQVHADRLEAGSWVGQGASNIRELFQTARDLAPVIIFVEDFDIFAGIRGNHVDTKKQDHEAFINQLLVELDGFEKQEGVVLMATTESLNKIDDALTRPGRMDRIFHLQRPTQGEREKILLSAAKDNMDKELVDFVDWQKVAEKTALMRPAELRSVPMALEGSAFNGKLLDEDELVSYCSWFMTLGSIVPNWVRKTALSKRINKMLVNHLGLGLTKEDMATAVDLMEPYGVISSGFDLSNPYISWTTETKFPHAVWAAGRGLLASLLPNFDVVHNLWLEPSSREGIGCTKITNEERGGTREGNVDSRSYLEKRLVFFFGSYIAAQMLLPFGEENLLSSSELEQAQELATRMVIKYGWGPSDNPTVYCHDGPTTLNTGDNHFHEMASNVETLYYLAYDRAKAILHSNLSVLEKMVEELVKFEVLQRKDIERIISENGGTREIEPFFLIKSRSEQQPPPVIRSLLENGSISGGVLITSPI